MEQESETPLLYHTVKRVGCKLVLVVHAIFIVLALVGTASLVVVLLFEKL